MDEDRLGADRRASGDAVGFVDEVFCKGNALGARGEAVMQAKAFVDDGV